MVLWYPLLYAALFGFLIHHIPFLPYPGMTAFFTALLTFPVVLAFMLLLILGFRIPNVIILFLVFPNKIGIKNRKFCNFLILIPIVKVRLSHCTDLKCSIFRTYISLSAILCYIFCSKL